jgi:hypothetical protein
MYMPQRTVFIRNEDMTLWMSVDRATLVRSALAYIRKQKAEGVGIVTAAKHVVITQEAELTPKMINSPPDAPAQLNPIINNQPLPAAPKQPAVLPEVPLWAVCVEMTGVVVKKNLTRPEAAAWLERLNVEGDLIIVQQ